MLTIADTRLRALGVFLALAALAVLGDAGRAEEKKAEKAAEAEARLLTDLKFLAGDECEGRGITTKGINKAADFIADEFKKAGVKPGAGKDGYFQNFSMTSGSKLEATNSVTLIGPKGQEFPLEINKEFTVCGLSNSGTANAPVVFVGFGATSKEPAYDDFDKIDVKGKVVVIVRRLPRQGDDPALGFPGGDNHPAAALAAKVTKAEINKAAAVIFVNDNAQAAQNKDALMSFSQTANSRKPAGIPAVHVRRTMVNQMIRSVKDEDLSAIEKRIDRDFKPQSFALDGWTCKLEVNVKRTTTAVKNVVGVLEGNGDLAKETVVIGAHYDHLGFGGAGGRPAGDQIHYGADDNASGTASLIELARRFGADPKRQGRRIVFIAFTAEELGLVGSRHYCENPLFPLEDTVAMVNMDMVGRLRDDKISLYGTGTAKEFDGHVDTLNKKYQFNIKRIPSGHGPSDHTSFYEKKVPVFHYFTNNHPEYHKPTDKIETINIEGVRKITEMIEESVQYLTTVEKRPTYVEIKPTGGGGPRGPRLGIMPNYDDDKDGVLIDGVTDGLPAAKAGIKKGDRILEINGKPTKNIEAYMAVMGGTKKGETLEVTVFRDGKNQKVEVKLE